MIPRLPLGHESSKTPEFYSEWMVNQEKHTQCTVLKSEQSERRGRRSPKRLKILWEVLEAPSGVEPLHRSFADCSLNHLGTAPHDDVIIVASFSLTQHGSKPAARYGAPSFKVSGLCPTTHLERSRTHISKRRL